jgi:recombination protein RecT
MLISCFVAGLLRRIHADVVYEGDIFVYELGEVKKHVPWAWRDDRKKPECTREGSWGVLLDRAEGRCDKVRSNDGGRYPSDSAPDRHRPMLGLWVTDTDEMRKKTPFRRRLKWVPLSSEYRDKIEKDDDVLDVEATVLSVAESLGQEPGMVVASPQVTQIAEPARIESQPQAEPLCNGRSGRRECGDRSFAR